MRERVSSKKVRSERERAKERESEKVSSQSNHCKAAFTGEMGGDPLSLSGSRSEGESRCVVDVDVVVGLRVFKKVNEDQSKQNEHRIHTTQLFRRRFCEVKKLEKMIKHGLQFPPF